MNTTPAIAIGIFLLQPHLTPQPTPAVAPARVETQPGDCRELIGATLGALGSYHTHNIRVVDALETIARSEVVESRAQIDSALTFIIPNAGARALAVEHGEAAVMHAESSLLCEGARE